MAYEDLLMKQEAYAERRARKKERKRAVIDEPLHRIKEDLLRRAAVQRAQIAEDVQDVDFSE